MFGGLKSGLKQRLKGVVEDIKGRRVDAADPYVPPPSSRPTPIARPSAPAKPEAAKPVAVEATKPKPVAPPDPEPAKPVAVEATKPKPVEPPEPERAKPAVDDGAHAAKVEAAAKAEREAEAAAALKAERAAAALAAKAEREAAKAAAAKAEAATAGTSSVAALAAAAAAGKVAQKVLHADTGSTDLDAYVARAKANGRDLSSISGGIGLNTAEDGAVYWGPVDNDSSRAKAAGKVLTIDQFECISCGTCVEQTDKVYYLPDDGKATPIAQDGPMDLIQDAIDACPVTCIAWVPPEEAEEKGLATGIDGAE